MGLGRLIAFEGLDGAGTTTQAKLLRDGIAGEGFRVHLTEEPSRGPIGGLLRLYLGGRLALPGARHLRKRAGGAALALLFAADRLDHLEAEIAPRLAEGWIVVTDRYLLSSFAYQGIDFSEEFVSAINAHARPPDLTILLDVPVSVCTRRMAASRQGAEHFEAEPALRRVRRNYRALAAGALGSKMKTVVVNGDRPPQEVHDEVQSIVRRALPAPKRNRGG